MDRRSTRITPYDDSLVVVIAVAGALAAALASGAPSGLAPANAVFRAVGAGLVTVAAARGRRWAGLVLAATAFAVAHQWQLVPAGAALLSSFVMTTRRVRLPLLGAAVGAVSFQVLLRQQPYAFHGASSLMGAAAVLPVVISAHRRSRSSARQRHRRILTGLAGLAMVATAAFGAALILARRDLETGASQARAALDAARSGDATTAQARLRGAGTALRHSASLTGSWWAAAARAVPLVGQQAEAVSLITTEGRNVVRSARASAAVGDYERLKYRSGRFDVSRLRELRRPLADSAATLARADRQLRRLDRSWLIGPLRSRIDEFGRDVARAVPEAHVASSVVTLAPGLLGADGPRHYFVAFITPAELRGAGGFIGNYGELTAANGRVRLTRSGPIRDLVNGAAKGRRRLQGPADYLRRYGEFNPADYFQDLTFSPHFPFDADAIEQLYPQSGGTRIDGVISVDPFALAALLRFTGPISVPGLDVALTPANAADILLRQQYVRFADNAARKDLLVEASRITFEKLTTGSLPAPQELARVLGPMVDQRRIMLHSTRAAEQRLFRDLHAEGALPSADGGDVLSIASDNSGNNKIDTFLHRDVDYEATIDPATGAVGAAVTVSVRNDAPASGLPGIVIGNSANLPAGTNLMSLSIYSPLELRDATIDGRPLGLLSDREAGLRVYTVRLRIPAGTAQTIRLHLAGGLDLRRGYRFVASPQPVANPDTLTISVRATPGWRLAGTPGLHAVAGGLTSGRRQAGTPTSFRVAIFRR